MSISDKNTHFLFQKRQATGDGTADTTAAPNTTAETSTGTFALVNGSTIRTLATCKNC